MIEYSEGNILESGAEALVNTVNTFGVMGKGIALQFKRAFPDMAKEYEAVCKRKELSVGKMHVWNNGMWKPRFIINFPTKQHWRQPSKMEYIREGLKDLIAVVRANNIRSIALPPLGCGLGGLAWSSVEKEIAAAFQPLSNVRVCLYPPIGTPEAVDMVNRTERPNLTLASANLIRLMSGYFDLGYDLHLIEVHKLAYFYQESGQSFNLTFRKDKYGPYAENLRHLLNRLEGHYISGTGAGDTRPLARIELLPNAAQQADKYLTEHPDNDSEQYAERVKNLIYGFESPYGMELLASVHWVATHESANTINDVIERIHSWNERKRRVIKPEHIDMAWCHLTEEGWIKRI